MPVGDVFVGDAGGHIEHDDTTLACVLGGAVAWGCKYLEYSIHLSSLRISLVRRCPRY